MALFGLLGGSEADPYDLYGDILSEKQRAALRSRSSDQTWANAANFLAKAAMPTNKKIPLGGLLAGLAGAMGGSNQDEAVLTALKGSEITGKVAKLRREQKFLDELSPYLSEAIKRQFGGRGGGVPPSAAAPAAQGASPAAAPGGVPASFVGGLPQVPSYNLGAPPDPAFTPGSLPQQQAGLLGVSGATEGIDALGGGQDIWAALAALSQGGGGGSGAPFDLASLGQGQGLPDVGQVQVEPLSGEADPVRSPEYLARRARDLDLTEKYESGGRNIMQQVVGPQGGYNPSVGRVTGPSSASGLYQMIKPTYEHAAKLAGIDVSQWPRAMDAPPAVQRKLAEALYDEQGNRPWDPYNKPLAAARGGGGLPDAGRVRVEPLGGEATPAGQAGLVPGLGVTPEALALMNAMAKLGGIDSPFGSLLETYYKSQGYLEEKARTEEVARKKIGLEYDPLIAAQTETAKAKVELEYKPKIEEAVQKLQSPILKEREQAKADIERVSKELEQNRQAGLTPVTVTVTPPGEDTPREITIAAAQLPQLATGQGIPQLGIPPGSRLGKPVLSPEQTATQTERGKAPYTREEITLTWPDGETRKVKVTGEQAKDVLEGRPVPAIGWPGTGVAPGAAAAPDSGARVGETVYPPGHAEATAVLLKERRPKAEAAVQSLNFNETATRLLDAGIISGYGASFRLDVAKAKSLLGWSDERIANTETFLATQARQVAAGLASGAFGSGSSITDTDREYMASMAGANSNLDEKSLRFLVRQNATAANWEIDRYNADVTRHDPKGRLPILRVDKPPKAETQPSANQPKVIGTGQLGGKPYVKWSDGQWRPEGELPGEEKR